MVTDNHLLEWKIFDWLRRMERKWNEFRTHAITWSLQIPFSTRPLPPPLRSLFHWLVGSFSTRTTMFTWVVSLDSLADSLKRQSVMTACYCNVHRRGENSNLKLFGIFFWLNLQGIWKYGKIHLIVSQPTGYSYVAFIGARRPPFMYTQHSNFQSTIKVHSTNNKQK